MRSNQIQRGSCAHASCGAWSRRRFYMSEIDRKSTRLVPPAPGSAAPSSPGAASVNDTDPGRSSSGDTRTFPISSTASETRGGFWPYVQIARVDHWFKNAFMALGTLLALFYRPDL